MHTHAHTYTQMDNGVGRGCVGKERLSVRGRGMRQGKRGENNHNLLCVSVKLSKNKQTKNLICIAFCHNILYLAYLVILFCRILGDFYIFNCSLNHQRHSEFYSVVVKITC